ncbi:tetratricopeptide repeat protein [Winogradskyella jejuensis]|uniref:Flp pilus assembly protein TadD, contains TPR repeats n=1 Tax=Winogradskyella jejuensis TaxID=1089305 RepID=A0A1M5P749_9FLAO|nr:tetratricopeptide repeat protein [Winogradskyella jejuensis]SHG97610.1 Flp pilus assembly protein TadD, contains TPR repeats [Winogradskyella jejuensis]
MLKRLTILILFIQFNAEAQSSALQLGDSLYANGNYSKAIKAYKKHTNQVEVYDKIAKTYLAIGNNGKALENYKKGVEANPKDALIKFEYAKLLSRSKKYVEASNLFEELIYVDYKNPNYHYQKGVVLEKLKDSTFLNRYLSAYQLDQTHQKAIFKIAKYYLMKRKHQASHKYIDKGLESYTENLELISLKAQNYYHQDYIKEAIIWFNKLLDLGETSEFIHEKLSICYAKNYDYEQAIFHRKKVLDYNPYDATSMYVIGTYYEELKDYKKAEEYISKSLKLQDKPLNDEYVKLGRIYNFQKKYEAAISAFQKAVKEDSKDIFAKFAIVRTKDEYYADRKAVIKLYEDFIKNHSDHVLARYAEARLKELKEEVFMDKN